MCPAIHSRTREGVHYFKVAPFVHPFRLKRPICPECIPCFHLIAIQVRLKQIPLPSFNNPCVYRYTATNVLLGLTWKKTRNIKKIFLLNPILSRCISPLSPFLFFFYLNCSGALSFASPSLSHVMWVEARRAPVCDECNCCPSHPLFP